MFNRLNTLEEFAFSTGIEELIYRGREVMETIGYLVCAVLLMEDAERDGDSVAYKVAARWLERDSTVTEQTTRDRTGSQWWREEAEWDRQIVFGEKIPSGQVPKKASL